MKMRMFVSQHFKNPMILHLVLQVVHNDCHCNIRFERMIFTMFKYQSRLTSHHNLLSFSLSLSLSLIITHFLFLKLSTILAAVHFKKSWIFSTYSSIICLIYTILFFMMNFQYICSHGIQQCPIL